ncbi:MAG: ribosomal protein S18-alanine N-acetyltransferase [Armatimonadota bacterium]
MVEAMWDAQPSSVGPTLSIEPMRASDVEDVARVERMCFTTHWPVNAFLNELSNRAACYLVARAGDLVVGYAGMWLVMDEAHITTLGVLPEWRRRGIGERLLVELLREARRRGAVRATLEVRVSNHAAQRLYDKYGFKTVAIRRGYYTDTNEDAMVMWLDDLWAPNVTRMLAEAGKEPDGKLGSGD